MKPVKTTIQVSEELHRFLTAQAITKGDTYDSIIKRILKQFAGVNFNNTADQQPDKQEEVC